MSAPARIPQTLTMMEACFTLAPGVEGEFWPAQDRFGPIAAAAPGFRGVLGGPIANSSWLYFGGIFATPADMDDWHHSRKHRTVQDKAHETWFDSYYIRKWRLPEEGEAVTGRVLVETSLGRPQPLAEAELASALAIVDEALPSYSPRPFETLIGRFEPQPYQFVGPLQEAPELAPARYLLLTHWDSPDQAAKWTESATLSALGEFGEAGSRTFVPIHHQPGERDHLTPDGSHREWVRAR
ncbi:hypothetical protein [Amycolatopsis alkalitolerans]|uniref:Antibiotic biosynthesis monooxygenase n=1 Tax=Amycolatopsis alkalitolerans TaxID=2547244 RepID=A0A5C4MCK7_9PSEU|nr:hypothetical protein [Amycolatopsis alkalitolerans]TNC29162.1 hypothetical protein FG385_03495 [Amycolatopsis alkalitolerans]